MNNDAKSRETLHIECVDKSGRLVASERIALEEGKRGLTIGRSPLADVVLSDEHVAAEHLSIERTADGKTFVNDLGSINGIVVEGEHYSHAKDLLVPRNRLEIGHTQIILRSSRDKLSPEKPLHMRPAMAKMNPVWIAAAGAFATVGQLAYSSWLSAPSDLLLAIVMALAGGSFLIGLWVAFWGLMSRVMRGKWLWMRHAAIAFVFLAVSMMISDFTKLGQYVLGLPDWIDAMAWVNAMLVAGLLYFHLRHASTLSFRRAAVLASILPVLSLGVALWLGNRSAARDVNAVDAQLRIYPPGFRLRAAEPLEAYFATLDGLRDEAEKKRDALPESENSDWPSVKVIGDLN